MTLNLLLIVFFLFTSAVLSGSEAAFLSVSEVRIQTLIQKNDRRAILVGKLRSNLHRLLGVLLFGQVISDVAASSLATVTATEWFGDIGVGIATGVMTFMVLIFGQLVPKSYGARQPERWTRLLAKPISWLSVVCNPILAVIDRLVVLVMRQELHFTAHSPVSEEEIKTMAQMGVKAGTLEKGEKELIERVFLFNDITASDVMTPRESILFLDGKKSLAEALPLVNSAGYSRYPVFENDKSNIIGVIHIKDLFRKLSENPGLNLEQVPIKDLAEPATFVPRTKPIDDLLRDMQKQHLHLAMVANEYGTIVGLVTFEDLLEELVGEISDESDIDEHIIKRVDKLNIIAHGDVDIKDINRFFNTKLTAPPHKSLGWVILKELGSIPTVGQQIKLDPCVTATVEEMINLRIHKVRLTKTDEPQCA